MIIDKVILSSNENNEYLNFWPIVSEAWKKLGVEPVLIYTGKKNINLEGNVINFHINKLDSAFVAQCIRLLTPSLFKNSNCIISDIDSLPLSKDYFINSVKSISESKFIIYRPDGAAKNMVPICWNLAKDNLWSEIFNINSEKDIVKKLRKWYVVENKLLKSGWYTDQIILKKSLEKYEKVNQNKIVRLDDKLLNFQRFNRVRLNEDLQRMELDNVVFTEFHMPRPYKKHAEIINKVYNKHKIHLE
jgi:hypothetical protein